MRIVIVHNAVTDDSPPDARDVLDQVGAVQDAASRLGHSVRRLACDLDLVRFRSELESLAPEVVFNLVESLGETDRLIAVVPALLETLHLPYTGNRADGLWMTTHKLMAKRLLASAGLPTPAWITMDGACHGNGPADQWIIKSVWEHGSLGLDTGAVVPAAPPHRLAALAAHRAPHLGGEAFAEAYVPGREFNLSLLDGPDGPEVLPPAEIVFTPGVQHGPQIVGYAAKWDPDSPTYSGTPRRFDFPQSDAALVNRLGDLAADCWHCFSLNGYARVDFRVDGQGQPWILEINANPCLSPDAGFAAATARAGLSMAQVIERILDAATAAPPTADGHVTPSPVDRPGKWRLHPSVSG